MSAANMDHENPQMATMESGLATPSQTGSIRLDLPQVVLVVKRNGMLVPFARERIVRAIELAFRDTKKIHADGPLSLEVRQVVEHVTYLVIQELAKQASQGSALTVEGIQDLVEIKLMESGHLDVARDYIIYRNEHKALREGAPQHFRIVRRVGEPPVRFNPIKIAGDLERIFRQAGHIEGALPGEVIDMVNGLTQLVVQAAMEWATAGNQLSTGWVQDEIERQLMQAGQFEIAKGYIVARQQKAPTSVHEPVAEVAAPVEVKAEPVAVAPAQGAKAAITVIGPRGSYIITEAAVRNRIGHAAKDLPGVQVEEMVRLTSESFYEGMREDELEQAYLMAARSKIEWDPDYSKFAARFLVDTMYRDLLGCAAHAPELESSYRKYFADYMHHGVKIGRVDARLLEFDLERLGAALDASRDRQFAYLGLQTLWDRYFIHEHQRRLELPQIFWMRVAMGLCLFEENRNERAIEFYNTISRFLYCPATPTLFNSGTCHPQLSSCYLSTVKDDLGHIFKVISDDAQLSKWAGGIGNDWTSVRATGALIKGTNGTSQGIIPFLKVANDTAVAVNQCFSPETLIYTQEGLQPIANVEIGDLVLGVSGTYRSVLDKFTYNQKDPMVTLSIKHALEPVSVTSGHPFYAICGVPMEQANQRTHQWLAKGKVKCEWVDAGVLKKGDYVAQTIPKEVVDVAEVSEDAARLYGILLGDGHLSKNGHEWGVSGNPQCDVHLEFVRKVLADQGIHYWETGRGTTYVQIHWAAGRGAVRDGTTGRITGSGAATMPFDRDDLYDAEGRKRIAPRLAHLPRAKALALVQGLIETDGCVSRGKEITFTNTSQPLVEGLRYQMLRLGVPTTGKKRVRDQAHVGTRSDGSEVRFEGTTTCYDLRIPALPELAERLGCEPLTKHNWLTVNGMIFTRVTGVTSREPTPFVCDLVVEGDESYMTTAGLAHNGGKRKGAMCAYLETWHLDIEDFLELRKNTGDERRRTHDMNTANWIPDLFFQRMLEGGMWTLFSPNDVPDLHEVCGLKFKERYEAYERMTETGEIKLFKRVEALQLWRRMLSMLFETGHPWMTFKDPSNLRSPQQHVGVVRSSNLCTEILLNSSEEETAVCNLGSINLAMHCTPQGMDEKLLSQTIRLALRMLDNVIDINFYPTKEASNSNHRHRPVGLGLMGFQDALYIQGISYASPAAVEFADSSMEMISFYALLSSSDLARERGAYSTYKGSLWDQGLLPIDTIDIMEKHRGSEFYQMDRSTRMPWHEVRESIRRYGIRNSNTMAIAPTATISNITGVTQSIEPTYKNLFVKSNLSGEFTVPNSYLVEVLKAKGMWDEEMIDDLKYFDGSLLEIHRIPEEVKQLFLTAFEIEPAWIIECGSRRQKWLDMGQSLNLYMAEPSGKKLSDMYVDAWKKGLKTTYYLRTLGATQIEKSTTDINKRGLQPRWMKNKSASANITVERSATVCTLGEGCESCQ